MKSEKKEVSSFDIIMDSDDGFMYKSKSKGLAVIQFISIESDGKYWEHTSYSRASKIPTYEDTQFIKKHFIGDNVKAIAVYPAKSEYVNIMPYCLHLWSCVEGDVLPDFTQGSGLI